MAIFAPNLCNVRMQVVEVGTNATYQSEFIQFPVRLYRNDTYWIRPLDTDVEEVFDPARNKRFSNGECVQYLLLNDKKETIGRIAAFVDREIATLDNDQPTGGLGFFECIDDPLAAAALFDAGKAWLQSRGMEAMDGPVNFGDRDRWWGLLFEGFDREPNYCMPYTKPYYIPLFENYGFQDYFKQFTFGIPTTWDKLTSMSQTVKDRAKRVYENPEYSFRTLDKKRLPEAAQELRHIYNAAWGGHSGVMEMSADQAQLLMKKLKPVIDEKIIYFAYHGEEPVAFFVCLPELNQVFKHVNGKLDLVGKLKFLWHMVIRKTNHKAFGVVFGVAPAHQGKGLEAAIALRMPHEAATNPAFQYDELEMNWVGDFNPIMVRFVSQLGSTIVKTHVTYRYLFDRTKPFKRCPVIGRKK
ncbi:hypothetical protein FHK02_4581 [Spirosoma sp. LMG 31448]|uniref:N-acetyltransferase domain-containing protein n=2 Tax=Spirosoma utsteinense TaxID=2585773 RepID=A0ABR6W622_9BACT|nr:hypothetical protein [Spirosoma utsteinense]MBC3791260.1 hypothetical protein [Spirosoma utsteinense]